VLEVIEDEELIDRAAKLGDHLLAGLREVADRHPTLVGNVRGRGLLCAVDLPDPAVRDALLADLFSTERVLLLGGGMRSLRFRPHLAVTAGELDAGLAALDRALARLARR
jgi:L-lysine 6-transaminase